MTAEKKKEVVNGCFYQKHKLSENDKEEIKNVYKFKRMYKEGKLEGE